MIGKALLSGFGLTVLDGWFGWKQGKEMKDLQAKALKLTENARLAHLKGAGIQSHFLRETAVQHLLELQMRHNSVNPLDIPRFLGIWLYDKWWNQRSKSGPLHMDPNTIGYMLALARYHLGVSYMKEGELAKAKENLQLSENYFSSDDTSTVETQKTYLKAWMENNEGVLWLSRGQYKKARHLFEKCEKTLDSHFANSVVGTKNPTPMVDIPDYPRSREMDEFLKLTNRKRLTVKLNILEALASELLFGDGKCSAEELKENCRHFITFQQQTCHIDTGAGDMIDDVWWNKVGKHRTNFVLAYCDAAIHLPNGANPVPATHVKKLQEEIASIPDDRPVEQARAHLALALYNCRIRNKNDALMHAKDAAFILDQRSLSMTPRDKQDRAIAEWVRFQFEKDRKKYLQKHVRAIFGMTEDDEFVSHPLYID
jgi:tetratricopeptide (TPR) repeat protein